MVRLVVFSTTHFFTRQNFARLCSLVYLALESRRACQFASRLTEAACPQTAFRTEYKCTIKVCLCRHTTTQMPHTHARANRSRCPNKPRCARRCCSSGRRCRWPLASSARRPEPARMPGYWTRRSASTPTTASGSARSTTRPATRDTKTATTGSTRRERRSVST